MGGMLTEIAAGAVGLVVPVVAASGGNGCAAVCDSNYRADVLLCDGEYWADVAWCDDSYPGDNEPWTPNWECRRLARELWGSCMEMAEEDHAECMRACPASPGDPLQNEPPGRSGECRATCRFLWQVDVLICDAVFLDDLDRCEALPEQSRRQCRLGAYQAWAACTDIADWDLERCERACPAEPIEPIER